MTFLFCVLAPWNMLHVLSLFLTNNTSLYFCSLPTGVISLVRGSVQARVDVWCCLVPSICTLLVQHLKGSSYFPSSHPVSSSSPTTIMQRHSFTALNSTFVVDSEYEFVKELGQGAYGCVVAARHRRSGEGCAIKKITNINTKASLFGGSACTYFHPRSHICSVS